MGKYRQEGKDVRVFVTTFEHDSEMLLKDLERKYLGGLAGNPNLKVRFMHLNRLAEELKVEWEHHKAEARVQGILDRLTSPDHQTILVVDEVRAGPGSWDTLVTSEHVDYIIAVSPVGKKVVAPSCGSSLCRQMVAPHRNCHEIREFLHFSNAHGGRFDTYLSTSEGP